MNRTTRLLLVLVFAFATFTRATCGKPRPEGVTPALKLTITDHVYFHNMGITWDGVHYFTVNGGNAQSGMVNEYDKNGNPVGSHALELDGRAISFHPEDEELYVKGFGSGLYSVDLDDESVEEELSDVFVADNSSVGFSPDGERVYELDDGSVTVYELETGEELDDFELSLISEEDSVGFDGSIAVSDKYLFAWADTNRVAVYDLGGGYVTAFDLPRAGYGFSLSWANGMLWIAADADGGTDGADGKWYGYQLKGLE